MRNTIMHFISRFHILFLLLFFLTMCTFSPDEQPKSIISIANLSELYDSFVVNTKVSDDNSIFCLNKFEPQWDQSIIRKNKISTSVRTPLLVENSLYFLLFDGKGYYLSTSINELSFVQDNNTKDFSIYFHFYIPFREAIEIGSDNLFLDLKNFSGLEIWATMQGKVIHLDRHYQGRVYESISALSNQISRDLIMHDLDYYIHAYFISITQSGTKSASPYVPDLHCPNCGGPLTIDFENELCYCMACGWGVDGVYDGFIDPSIIWGNGNTDVDEDSSNNLIIPSEFYLDETYGGSPLMDSIIDSQAEIIAQYFLGDGANTRAVNALKHIYQDCSGRYLIARFMDSQFMMSERDSLPSRADALFSGSNGSIYYLPNRVNEIVLLEELFHALQFSNRGTISNSEYNGYGVNREIEAKMYTYIYAMTSREEQSLDVSYRGYSNRFKNVFLNLLNGHHIQGYDAAITLMSDFGYDLSRESYQYRSMDNLSYVFGCDKYSGIRGKVDTLVISSLVF